MPEKCQKISSIIWIAHYPLITKNFEHSEKKFF